MKCEVLVSTMNKKSKKELIKSLRINCCTIINQITNRDMKYPKDDTISSQKFLSFKEKGLSKSRNKAIENCSSDICVIADDDMYYVDEYEKIIKDAYKKYPDADLIAFVVDNEDVLHKKRILKEGRVGYLRSMKLQSVQVTFKRASIIKNNIKFDESFGTGSTYYWGEENIFLFDCLRSNLKIYYVPQKIATLKISNSSWNKDNTVEHYKIQGTIYYRMSNIIYPILIIQFAIRKRNIYKNDMSMFKVIKSMFQGAKEYKKGVI